MGNFWVVPLLHSKIDISDIVTTERALLDLPSNANKKNYNCVFSVYTW